MNIQHRWIILSILLLVTSTLSQLTPYFLLNMRQTLLLNGIVFVILMFFAFKSVKRPKVLNPPKRMNSEKYEPTTTPPTECDVVRRLRIGTIIDPPTGNPLMVSDDDLKRHMVIVGQSGTGKTVCIENLLWQQIRRGGGAVFMDGKLDGDTLVKMKKMMFSAGRIDELYVVNPDDPEISHSYNPLLSGDVESIVNRIMSTYSSGGAVSATSEHFMAMNRSGLSIVIAAIKRLGLAFNFEDLSIIMSSPTAFTELWKMLPSDSKEKSRMATYMENMMTKNPIRNTKEIDLKKFKENLGGLASRMSALSEGGVGQIFNSYSPQVKMYDVIINNRILYIMLPTMEKSETSAKYVAQFVISDLQTAIARVQKLLKHEKPSTPFLLLFDEFGAYATYSSRIIWEQARSAGICAAAAFQTFSSLERLGADFRNMIMGNSMVKIFYALRDGDSPEQASKLLGYVEERKTELGEEEFTDEDDHIHKKRVSKTSGTYQKVGSNIFKDLQLGEAVVSVVNDIYKVKGPMVDGFDKVPSNIELTYRRETSVPGLNFSKVWDRLLRREFDFEETATNMDPEEEDYLDD